MASDVNKNGLRRHIPSDVKFDVRKRCGFGCVVCGQGIYEYDHIDPPFADATEHKADGIALLCMQHHGEKTRGFLSEATVKEAMKAPAALRKGYAFRTLDISREWPTIRIGALTFERVKTLIQIEGEPVLSLRSDNDPSAPFLLSAKLRGPDGQITLSILDNEWRIVPDAYDAQAVGGKISIYDNNKNTILSFRTTESREVIFDQINMSHRGHELRCGGEGDFEISYRGRGLQAHGSGSKFVDAEVGLDARAEGLFAGRGGGVHIKHMTLGNLSTSSGSQVHAGRVPRTQNTDHETISRQSVREAVSRMLAAADRAKP